MKPEINDRVAQRIFIWCCWRLNEDLLTIIAKIQVIFGEAALSDVRVRFWLREFRNGRTCFWDKERSGRPRTGRSDENVEAVLDTVANDQHATVSQISSIVQVSHTTVHRILCKDLTMFKKCAKFIPKILTQQNKDRRVRICRVNLDRYNLDRRLFHQVITGDESYIHLYDPRSKEGSRQWLNKDDDRPQKALQGCGGWNSKTLLVVFFDYRGIVHREFHRNTNINSDLYLQILQRLHTSIHHRRIRAWRNGTYILHDDNACLHRCDQVLNLLHQTHTRVLDHPAYSPDLAPVDFFLFPRLKELKGERFPDLDTLEDRVDEILGSITQAEFQKALTVSWRARMRKCIRFHGRYFEGMHHPDVENLD